MRATPPTQERPSLLAIHLLLSFRVFVDGEAVNARLGGKAKELLKVLAAHYHTVLPRDAIIELLWPNSEPAIGAVSLKVTAHNLRMALEPEKKSGQPGNWILVENGSYRLNPQADIWIDARAVKQYYDRALALLAERRIREGCAELRRVDELYVGDLLEEDIYEDWTIVRREELRDIYLDAISRLAESSWQQQAYADVIRNCHKIVLVDPCREDAYRMLMKSHAALNQLARAGSWYAVCRQALSRDMDSPVSAETQTLFERLFQPDAPDKPNRASAS